MALFDLNEAAGEALAKELGGVFCLVDVTKEDSVDAGFAKARAAIEAGKDIALSNKETLVTAGAIITELVKKKGVKLLLWIFSGGYQKSLTVKG